MTEPAPGTACYELEAQDPAQVLCRVLGLFAQQDRPLASVVAHSSGDRMHAMVRLGGIDAARAAVLAEKLRALAMVERVEFTFSPARTSGSGLRLGGLRRGRFRRAQHSQDVAAGHLADVLG